MKPSLATLQRIKACTLNVVVLILIATLCCILFGCRSSRSSTKVDYQRKAQGTTTTTTTTDVWKFLNSVRTENELTDEETEWIIFDTSCTDSTGAHPILSYHRHLLYHIEHRY